MSNNFFRQAHVTLNQFLKMPFPVPNHPMSRMIQHPRFTTLYLRKGPIYVTVADQGWICDPCLVIANISANHPGQGHGTKLIRYLMEQDYAIMVELVHNKRFCRTLESMGFTRVNELIGPHCLINHEKRLKPIDGYLRRDHHEASARTAL